MGIQVTDRENKGIVMPWVSRHKIILRVISAIVIAAFLVTQTEIALAFSQNKSALIPRLRTENGLKPGQRPDRKPVVPYRKALEEKQQAGQAQAPLTADLLLNDELFRQICAAFGFEITARAAEQLKGFQDKLKKFIDEHGRAAIDAPEGLAPDAAVAAVSEAIKTAIGEFIETNPYIARMALIWMFNAQNISAYHTDIGHLESILIYAINLQRQYNNNKLVLTNPILEMKITELAKIVVSQKITSASPISAACREAAQTAGTALIDSYAVSQRSQDDKIRVWLKGRLSFDPARAKTGEQNKLRDHLKELDNLDQQFKSQAGKEKIDIAELEKILRRINSLKDELYSKADAKKQARDYAFRSGSSLGDLNNEVNDYKFAAGRAESLQWHIDSEVRFLRILDRLGRARDMLTQAITKGLTADQENALKRFINIINIRINLLYAQRYFNDGQAYQDLGKKFEGMAFELGGQVKIKVEDNFEISRAYYLRAGIQYGLALNHLLKVYNDAKARNDENAARSAGNLLAALLDQVRQAIPKNTREGDIQNQFKTDLTQLVSSINSQFSASEAQTNYNRYSTKISNAYDAAATDADQVSQLRREHAFDILELGPQFLKDSAISKDTGKNADYMLYLSVMLGIIDDADKEAAEAAQTAKQIKDDADALVKAINAGKNAINTMLDNAVKVLAQDIDAKFKSNELQGALVLCDRAIQMVDETIKRYAAEPLLASDVLRMVRQLKILQNKKQAIEDLIKAHDELIEQKKQDLAKIADDFEKLKSRIDALEIGSLTAPQIQNIIISIGRLVESITTIQSVFADGHEVFALAKDAIAGINDYKTDFAKKVLDHVKAVLDSQYGQMSNFTARLATAVTSKDPIKAIRDLENELAQLGKLYNLAEAIDSNTRTGAIPNVKQISEPIGSIKGDIGIYQKRVRETIAKIQAGNLDAAIRGLENRLAQINSFDAIKQAIENGEFNNIWTEFSGLSSAAKKVYSDWDERLEGFKRRIDVLIQINRAFDDISQVEGLLSRFREGLQEKLAVDMPDYLGLILSLHADAVKKLNSLQSENNISVNSVGDTPPAAMYKELNVKIKNGIDGAFSVLETIAGNAAAKRKGLQEKIVSEFEQGKVDAEALDKLEALLKGENGLNNLIEKLKPFTLRAFYSLGSRYAIDSMNSTKALVDKIESEAKGISAFLEQMDRVRRFDTELAKVEQAADIASIVSSLARSIKELDTKVIDEQINKINALKAAFESLEREISAHSDLPGPVIEAFKARLEKLKGPIEILWQFAEPINKNLEKLVGAQDGLETLEKDFGKLVDPVKFDAAIEKRYADYIAQIEGLLREINAIGLKAPKLLAEVSHAVSAKRGEFKKAGQDMLDAAKQMRDIDRDISLDITDIDFARAMAAAITNADLVGLTEFRSQIGPAAERISVRIGQLIGATSSFAAALYQKAERNLTQARNRINIIEAALKVLDLDKRLSKELENFATDKFSAAQLRSIITSAQALEELTRDNIFAPVRNQISVKLSAILASAAALESASRFIIGTDRTIIRILNNWTADLSLQSQDITAVKSRLDNILNQLPQIADKFTNISRQIYDLRMIDAAIAAFNKALNDPRSSIGAVRQALIELQRDHPAVAADKVRALIGECDLLITKERQLGYDQVTDDTVLHALINKLAGAQDNVYRPSTINYGIITMLTPSPELKPLYDRVVVAYQAKIDEANAQQTRMIAEVEHQENAMLAAVAGLILGNTNGLTPDEISAFSVTLNQNKAFKALGIESLPSASPQRTKIANQVISELSDGKFAVKVNKDGSFRLARTFRGLLYLVGMIAVTLVMLNFASADQHQYLLGAMAGMPFMGGPKSKFGFGAKDMAALRSNIADIEKKAKEENKDIDLTSRYISEGRKMDSKLGIANQTRQALSELRMPQMPRWITTFKFAMPSMRAVSNIGALAVLIGIIAVILNLPPAQKPAPVGTPTQIAQTTPTPTAAPTPTPTQTPTPTTTPTPTAAPTPMPTPTQVASDITAQDIINQLLISNPNLLTFTLSNGRNGVIEQLKMNAGQYGGEASGGGSSPELIHRLIKALRAMKHLGYLSDAEIGAFSGTNNKVMVSMLELLKDKYNLLNRDQRRNPELARALRNMPSIVRDYVTAQPTTVAVATPTPLPTLTTPPTVEPTEAPSGSPTPEAQVSEQAPTGKLPWWPALLALLLAIPAVKYILNKINPLDEAQRAKVRVMIRALDALIKAQSNPRGARSIEFDSSDPVIKDALRSLKQWLDYVKYDFMVGANERLNALNRLRSILRNPFSARDMFASLEKLEQPEAPAAPLSPEQDADAVSLGNILEHISNAPGQNAIYIQASQYLNDLSAQVTRRASITLSYNVSEKSPAEILALKAVARLLGLKLNKGLSSGETTAYTGRVSPGDIPVAQTYISIQGGAYSEALGIIRDGIDTGEISLSFDKANDSWKRQEAIKLLGKTFGLTIDAARSTGNMVYFNSGDFALSRLLGIFSADAKMISKKYKDPGIAWAISEAIKGLRAHIISAQQRAQAELEAGI